MIEDLDKWIDNIDMTALVGALADDVVVEHVTAGRRIEGKKAALAWLGDLAHRSQEDRIEIVRRSVDGSRIWAERVDRHLIDGQWLEIPVMGVIELNDDRQIILIRDYFDPGLAIQ